MTETAFGGQADEVIDEQYRKVITDQLPHVMFTLQELQVEGLLCDLTLAVGFHLPVTGDSFSLLCLVLLID